MAVLSWHAAVVSLSPGAPCGCGALVLHGAGDLAGGLAMATALIAAQLEFGGAGAAAGHLVVRLSSASRWVCYAKGQLCSLSPVSES